VPCDRPADDGDADQDVVGVCDADAELVASGANRIRCDLALVSDSRVV
jgi:hypothetical protein